MPEYPFAIERLKKGAWLKLHHDREHISASQVGTIMNLNEYESPEMLWAVRTGRAKSTKDETPAMMMGHAAEKVIATLFKTETKKKVFNPAGEYGIVRHEQSPWLFATLDRVVPEDDIFVPLELKNTSRHDLFGDDHFPLAYELQLQVQMACINAPYGYLAVLVGNRTFKWYRREYRADIMGTVLQKCREFRQLILDDKRPVMQYDNPSTQAMISQLHPDDNGLSIPIPSDSDRLIEEIWSWMTKKEEAESEIAKRQAKLKDYIGDNTFGTTANGRKVSWKTQSRKEFVVKASTSRVLRIPNRPKEEK